MATIREKRPGVFEVREYVGRDAKGRPKQVSRIVRGTIKDARKLASELAVRPTSPEGAATTLGELLDLWVEANEPYWAPSSAQNQRSRARLVQADQIATLPVSRVTTVEIDRWHVRMAHQGAGGGIDAQPPPRGPSRPRTRGAVGLAACEPGGRGAPRAAQARAARRAQRG